MNYLDYFIKTLHHGPLVPMFCTEKLSIVVEDVVECTHSINRDIECVHSIKQGVNTGKNHVFTVLCNAKINDTFACMYDCIYCF